MKKKKKILLFTNFQAESKFTYNNSAINNIEPEVPIDVSLIFLPNKFAFCYSRFKDC